MGDYQAEETATPGTVIEGQSRREDGGTSAIFSRSIIAE